MRRENLPLYAVGAAILIVGLAAVGVPVTTLLFPLILLACPLMMMFMMGGMNRGGHDQHSHAPEEDTRPHDPTNTR